MIVERASFRIQPGQERAFEQAMEQAKEVIAHSPGFRSLKLMRGIEEPSTFLLINEWDTVEDHMHGFRESERFAQWRGLIGPFFAAPPEVDHYQAPSVTR